jgi:integrase
MPLTDVAIRKAKPSDKTQRLFDGGGMYLEIAPSGGKWWRLKYRFGGKEKRLSLGTYPTIGLAEARTRRDDARRLLAAGIDPSVHRQAAKAMDQGHTADSFEAIAREWFAKQSTVWAASHASKVKLRLENDLFPWLGARPVTEISTRELLTTLNRIVDRGAVESAHRVLQYCSQIFRYAIRTDRAERNPAADLCGALPPVKARHHAALTEPKAIGALLRAVDSYEGSLITKCALKLAPLLFARPGELRYMEWKEIDFESAQWNLPAEKMKMRIPHIVPLVLQSLAILRELQPLTGDGRYVFPSARSPQRAMSENAVLAALRRMGYTKEEMTGHGFRAMARTVLDEVLHFRPDYIEHQLAHAVRDPNGRAYNRTSFLPERRQMMQAWADYLDTLKADTGQRASVKTESGNRR